MRFVAALALLAMLVPAGLAEYSPGTAVDKPDYDYFPSPNFNDDDYALCFVDDDGSSDVNVGELLYIKHETMTCGEVGIKDYRLNGDKAASQVKSRTEFDFGFTLSAVPDHALRYHDIDIDGKLKKKDTLYLDLNNLAGMTVGPGDLRMMPFGEHPAFTEVMAGDSDVTLGLADLKGADKTAGGVPAKIGEECVVYEAGKGFYVNADTGKDLDKTSACAAVGVEEGDVRILKVPTPWDDLVAGSGPEVGKPTLEIVSQTEKPALGLTLVTVQVKNAGTITGAGLLETTSQGVIIDARGTPTLAPGEEATLVIALPPATEPEVNVASEQTPAPSFDAPDYRQNTPGFGLIAGLAAIGAILAIARRQ